MLFNSLHAKSSMRAADRFGWYPDGKKGEHQEERERRITYEWCSEHLSPEAWRQCKQLLERFSRPSGAEFLREMCRLDAAPLIELLYPRSPGLFLNSRTYTIPNQLFLDQLQTPLSTQLLQRSVAARNGQLNGTCLCAISGAVSCLEALLEQGADPNGLDRPEGWSYLTLKPDLIMPVTPLDCALLAGQEDCRLVLEMFGGKGIHELILD